MEKKVILRNKFLRLRAALNPEQVRAYSESIKQKVIKLKEFKQARLICCYLSFKNEVQTDGILKVAREFNKKISVPVIKDGQSFFLSEVEDIDRQLRKGFTLNGFTLKGKFGIRQPKKEFIKEVNPVEIDLILVPGIAFDLKGYRLGWGRGYYDRFLAGLDEKIPLVGLAYDFQVTERVPVGRNDVQMDKIITERRIILVKW